MKAHPLAELFPLMEGEPFRKLCESIKANGLEHEIIRDNGLIIDGRNRQRACDLLGITPRYTEFQELQLHCPIEQYIWDSNANRRHLTDHQKAAIQIQFLDALKKEGKRAMAEGGKKGGETAGRGRRKSDSDRGLNERSNPFSAPRHISREKAAKQAGVSERMIESAARVSRTAPELLPRVVSGELTLPQALRQSEGMAEPTKRNEINQNAEKRRTIALLSSIEGACDGLDRVKLDLVLGGFCEAELTQWIDKAIELSSRVRQFARKLRNGSGENGKDTEH